MSHNNSNYMNYMDGVPVKISDKYKPPTNITLPYSVLESNNRVQNILENTHYDFSLETNVLKKLREWQDARETAKNARNHRLQLLEEAKQRELDLKAATETEEKLKQLSISEVSYPSTEEISEISPDDNEESNVAENVITANPTINDNTVENSLHTSVNINKPDVVCDILQPVPVSPSPSPRCAPTNLLDDPPYPLPLPQLQSQQNMKFFKQNYMKNNLDNLTYSDFENDTSSPFDNMELKTINEKELLAQVLNINQTNNCTLEKNVMTTQQYNNLYNQQYSNNSHSSNCIDSNVPVYNTPGDNTIIPSNANTTQHQHYPYTSGALLQNNGYFNDNTNHITAFNSTMNYFSPEYNEYSTPTPYQPVTNINFNEKPYVYNNKINEQQTCNVNTNQPYQRDINNVDQTSYINQYGYYNTNYYYVNPNVDTNNTTFLPLNKQSIEETTLKTEPTKESLFGSRSRSVPDIVKELDEEVSMARMRAKERSHNCSPFIRPSSENVPSTAKKIEQLNNPYSELSPELQGICKRISSMGFPLDRVARACEDIGAEEKKIIEFLLIMGQLMDLGFTEISVGDALLKHNCNRDKALDELIS